MFAALPLLLLPVLVYNLLALTLEGGFNSHDAALRLNEAVLRIQMSSGVGWVVSLSDLILAGSLVVLFTEMLKATSSRQIAIVNHSLSMVLFIACLIEFLLVPAFGTSTFFLLFLMVFSDVLAGFVVTLSAARRDIGYVPH
jgi:hypothetical protein